MTPDFAAHLQTLFSCRACPNVAGQPVTGAVPDARVMLVGQAPGPREQDERRPFAYTAGKRLFQWIAEHVGISEDEFRRRVYIGAVIRCFPGRDAKAGGDRVPDPSEIANCAAHLDREIALLRPSLIIAVGTLAAKQLLGRASVPLARATHPAPRSSAPGGTPAAGRRDACPPLDELVGRVHRASRAGHEFDVIVLPHPSGRSTWTNRPGNRELLEKSLKLIRKALRRSF